jgi:c-di-GMP-binding flagellar brake protein YcgR
MAEQAAAERRKNPRVAVALDVGLKRKVGNPVTVRSRDLSTGGAYVVSPRPLQIFEALEFDLELADGSHVSGMARVLRQHQHDAYALRFEDLAPDALQTLATFVEVNSPPVSVHRRR